MLKLSPLRRTLSAAIRDAEDKKEAVRLSAVRDLAMLAREADNASAVEALEGVLERDASVAVAAEAVLALADADAKRSVPQVVEAALSGAPRVRQMALIALGELGTPGDSEVIRAVEPALKADAPALRFQALIAFCRVCPDRFREAVVYASRDDDAEVRSIALRLAEERWGDDEELPADVRARADALVEDESPRVRLLAAILLCRFGSRRGASAIVEAVRARTGTHEPEDEQAAVDLAGELGLQEASSGLERRAFGLFSSRKAFAWQARVALARMGHSRAREQILRELHSWSRDTRTLAVVAAGRARLREAREQILLMGRDEARADPTAVEEALELLGAGA